MADGKKPASPKPKLEINGKYAHIPIMAGDGMTIARNWIGWAETPEGKAVARAIFESIKQVANNAEVRRELDALMSPAAKTIE